MNASAVSHFGGSIKTPVTPVVASANRSIHMAGAQDRLRLAAPDDADAIAALFRGIYGKSTHPCADAGHLHDLLARDRMRMIVVIHAGGVIGCFAAIATRVPGVVDMGYMVMHRDYRQLGYSTRMNDAVMRAAQDMPDCDVIISFLRSSVTYHLAKTNPDLPRVPFGHDGGMNVANGVREYHAIAFGINPRRLIRRARPTRPLAIVEKRLGRLANVIVVSAQPRAWGVPPPDEMPDSAGTIASVPLAIPDPSSTLAGALSRVDDELGTHAGISHKFIYVPAERRNFIAGLHARGFRGTAYLPAWHREDGIRHDCVLMVRSSSRCDTRAYGLGPFVGVWDRQLSSLVESAATGA